MLELKNISKSFKGLTALLNVSFEVSRGEILGLMGPNGAGKTTLINLMSRFLTPTSGEIIWKGINIQKLKSHHLVGKGISRTFQQPRVFFNMSIFDNIYVGLLPSNKLGLFKSNNLRDRVFEIIEKVSISNAPSTLARDLLHNELRKLEIARAIGADPELLLLDEIVSGLTAEESNEIGEIIRMLNQAGLTILIIEHVMKFLMNISQRVVVLDHGEKICEGTPEEISRNPKVLDVYFGKGEEESLAQS
jgi:branched-chain amino acid transport system ATP-binding protein